MESKIIYIGIYNESDELGNGFMQLYHSHKKFLNNSSVVYFNFKKLFFYCPWIIFKRINSFGFIYPRKKINRLRNCDFLVIDSSPWTILYYNQIIDFFCPKKVFYRQSDPIGEISEHPILIKKENELIQYSSKSFFVNEILFKKFSKSYKDKILRNPSKLNSKVISTKKILQAIFFGKISIDLNFLVELAFLNPDLKILIIGNYNLKYHKQHPQNLIFTGYKSIEYIHFELSRSMFFILPYLNDNIASNFLGITSKIVDAIKSKCVLVINNNNQNIIEEGLSFISGPTNLNENIYREFDNEENLRLISSKFDNKKIFNYWLNEFE